MLAPDLFWRLEPGRRPRLHARPTGRRPSTSSSASTSTRAMDDITAAVKALRARPEVRRQGRRARLLPRRQARLSRGGALRRRLSPSATTASASRQTSNEPPDQVPDGAALRREGQVRAGRGGARRSRPRSRTGTTSRSTSIPGSDHAFARTGGDHYDKPAALMAHSRSIALFRARAWVRTTIFSALWDTHYHVRVRHARRRRDHGAPWWRSPMSITFRP